MENLKTIVINLIAPPGTGKSTIMAELFAELKWFGVDTEIAPEFAKELTWEERHKTLSNQRYLFGKQHHRLFRIKDKVEIIITDCPLILGLYYDRAYGKGSKAFEALVMEEINEYQNINIFLNRTKDYNPNGRNQTEAESDQFGIEIKKMITELGQEYYEMDAVKKGTVFKIFKLLTQIEFLDVYDSFNYATDKRMFFTESEDIEGVHPNLIYLVNNFTEKTVDGKRDGDVQLWLVNSSEYQTVTLKEFADHFLPLG